MSTGDRVVTFQGHHSYIVSIAKLCKENGLFTDVTILCDDGKLLAHKIVLAAVSPFLRHVLDVETSNTGQTTIVMPEVRKEIVQQLLDFLYTGIMKVSCLVARVLLHLYIISPSSCRPRPLGNSSSWFCCSRLTRRMLVWTPSILARTLTKPAVCRLASARLLVSR